MRRSCHLRVILLTATIALTGPFCLRAVGRALQGLSQGPSLTAVHLQWGQRAGITRYRLQLARDRGFSDIVLDRVVTGHEAQIDDLEPGRYFWRVAPLAPTLNFSPAEAIEVRPQPRQSNEAGKTLGAERTSTPGRS